MRTGSPIFLLGEGLDRLSLSVRASHCSNSFLTYRSSCSLSKGLDRQIKGRTWNMDSMILSAITNLSLFGATVKMQIRQTSNHSTSLEINNQLGLKAAKGVACKRGMILPFESLAMSFEDVNYFIDMPPEMREQGLTEGRLQLLQMLLGHSAPVFLQH